MGKTSIEVQFLQWKLFLDFESGADGGEENPAGDILQFSKGDCEVPELGTFRRGFVRHIKADGQVRAFIGDQQGFVESIRDENVAFSNLAMAVLADDRAGNNVNMVEFIGKFPDLLFQPLPNSIVEALVHRTDIGGQEAVVHR